MNLNAKYDVFVSYSRKDYVDGTGAPVKGCAKDRLLTFLDEHHITYWFDKNGIYSGSEFVEVITDAITDSKMMIFVSSKHSNESPWTTGEIFEALEQDKLIVPFKIDDSQYNKKFRMMVRPLDYIEYHANPEVAFDSLLKAINVCKEEYNQALMRLRKTAIAEEIKTESLDYKRHAATLASDALRLAEKQKMVGVIEKKCPVCSAMQPIESAFCTKCGWAFTPLFDANPGGNNDHLFVMRSLWKSVQDADTAKEKLENRLLQCEAEIKEKTKLITSLHEELAKGAKAEEKLARVAQERDELQLKLRDLQRKIENLVNEFSDKETQVSHQLSKAKTEHDQLMSTVAKLQTELQQKDANLQTLQDELAKDEELCEKLTAELKTCKTKETAEEPAEKVAAEQGDAKAQNSLGNYYSQCVEQSCKEAVKWYRKAAEQGYAEAQNNLAICYDLGYGVEQSYKEAMKWYTKAAEQGYAIAQCYLGNCYYYGNGVEQAYEKAVEWYTKAAIQGNADAQNNLGDCYYNGEGVLQSYEKAVEWYTKSAEQGNDEAQYSLGICYHNGDGVKQSDDKSAEWYRKSAEQGNEAAKATLENLGYPLP